MEKKQEDAKRQDRQKITDDKSGSVTGSVIMGDQAIKGQGISISVGSGSYLGGDISTGGGDFVGRDKITNFGVAVDKVTSQFKKIFAHIDSKTDLDEPDRNDLISDVKDIQEEASKGDFADLSILSRRLRNLQRMAPDILGMVLETLANPTVGFSAAVQKVAAQMQQASS